jgi:hypothetical protein
MASAKVYCPNFSVFGPVAVVQGGWVEEFPLLIHGSDVPNGFMVDAIQVSFLDSDNATAMGGKIKDAAIAKAASRGVTVPINGVVSYGAPERL